jgi:hypothetical protein
MTLWGSCTTSAGPKRKAIRCEGQNACTCLASCYCANDFNYKYLSVTSVKPDEADEMLNQDGMRRNQGLNIGKFHGFKTGKSTQYIPGA